MPAQDVDGLPVDLIAETATGTLKRQFGTFYNELRATANALMQTERTDHTLTPTGLVHEAYLRLLRAPESREMRDNTYFFASIRQAMRRILIEHARHRQRRLEGQLKKDSSEETLDRIADDLADRAVEFDDLESALEELEAVRPRASHAFTLYFRLVRRDEVASFFGVSQSSVEKDLQFAKAWLKRRFKR